VPQGGNTIMFLDCFAYDLEMLARRVGKGLAELVIATIKLLILMAWALLVVAVLYAAVQYVCS